jgi:hypothetical protein
MASGKVVDGRAELDGVTANGADREYRRPSDPHFGHAFRSDETSFSIA